MGFVEAISATKVAIEAISEFQAIANNAHSKREKQELLRMLRALRQIYFTPKGVLFLIEGISEGIPPSDDQIEALRDFNDGEWNVHRSIQRLDRIDNPTLSLSLKTQRALSQLASRKMGLRHQIQIAINRSVTFGELVDPEIANELLLSIRSLNNVVEDADEALLRALR
jgi:hypothetical protein